MDTAVAATVVLFVHDDDDAVRNTVRNVMNVYEVET